MAVQLLATIGNTSNLPKPVSWLFDEPFAPVWLADPPPTLLVLFVPPCGSTLYPPEVLAPRAPLASLGAMPTVVERMPLPSTASRFPHEL